MKYFIFYIVNTLFMSVLLVYHVLCNKKIEKFINMTALDINVYVINLKRNPKRLVNFKKNYEKTDLSHVKFEVIEAVDGKTLDVQSIITEKAYTELMDAERRGYRIKHYQITRGAIGCYLSHLEAYKRIAESDKDYGLVFEDDVDFNTSEILQDLQNKIRTIHSEWDIMLLGCVCYVCNGYKDYYDAQKFILLHAYIVKKESAKKILEELEGKPIEKQIDSKFSDMAESGKLRVVCLKEQLASQNNNDYKTTIQLPIKKIPGVNPFSN